MNYWNFGILEFWKRKLSCFLFMIPSFLTIILIVTTMASNAQPGKTIDQVAAVVGNKIILKSDIEQQYLQYIGQGN